MEIINLYAKFGIDPVLCKSRINVFLNCHKNGKFLCHVNLSGHTFVLLAVTGRVRDKLPIKCYSAKRRRQKDAETQVVSNAPSHWSSMPAS